MTKPNEKLVKFPRQSARDILTDVLRDGARQMLATAIEAEVEDYITDRTTAVDTTGRRGVVRNGHLPERTIQTPLGDVRVQQPRVRDRRPADERETFRSAILRPTCGRRPAWRLCSPGSISRASARGTSGRHCRRCGGPRRAGCRRRPSRG